MTKTARPGRNAVEWRSIAQFLDLQRYGLRMLPKQPVRLLPAPSSKVSA